MTSNPDPNPAKTQEMRDRIARMIAEGYRACEVCAHWRGNVQREVPAKPDGLVERRKYGVVGPKVRRAPHDLLERWEVADQFRYRQHVIDMNDEGLCHRYPDSQTTNRNYVCGEFAQREAGE